MLRVKRFFACDGLRIGPGHASVGLTEETECRASAETLTEMACRRSFWRCGSSNISRAGQAVGVTALARALGTTKSRIYRHLRTLVQQGYIVQSADTERYRIGSRLLTLGRAVTENFDLTAAYETIRELRDTLGLSCVVSQVEPAGVRVLAPFPGNRPSKSASSPGRSFISTVRPRARSRWLSAGSVVRVIRPIAS